MPQAIRDVFELIERTPDREFLLRLSMMEIYNEVLNDLLDNGRTNLKLREDKRTGVCVCIGEGGGEEGLQHVAEGVVGDVPVRKGRCL